MSDRVVVMRGGTVAGIARARSSSRPSVCCASRSARTPHERASALLRAHASGSAAYLRELGTAAALGAAPARADRGRTAVLHRGQPARPGGGQRARADHRGRHDARVLLTGHVDISVGSHFAVCSRRGRPARARRPADAAGARRARSSCSGALLGAVNGLFVARLGLPSIVVTLATMVIVARQSALGDRRGVGAGPAGRLPVVRPGQPAGEWPIVLTALARARWRAPAALRSLAAGRAIYAVGSIPKPHAWPGLRPAPVGARRLHRARHVHGTGRGAERRSGSRRCRATPASASRSGCSRPSSSAAR